MQRGTKRALVGSLIGVAALALLIGGAVIALAVMNANRNPATHVEQYLALIADGKAAAANAMVDPGLSAEQAALLTDEVLGSAAEGIVVVSVETLRRDGDGAQVEATLELDGARYTHTFALEHGPKEWLMLDTWQLRDPFVVETSIVAYDAYGVHSALVGEVTVDLERDMDSSIAKFFLYPGVYVVSGPSSRYLDVSREAVYALSPNDPVQVSIWAEPSAALESEILRQSVQAAQSCVTVPSNMNSECPSIVQHTGLSMMAVTEVVTQLDYLSATEFETGFMTISVRDASARPTASPRTDRVFIRGSIEWDAEGNPHIVEYTFI